MTVELEAFKFLPKKVFVEHGKFNFYSVGAFNKITAKRQ